MQKFVKIAIAVWVMVVGTTEVFGQNRNVNVDATTKASVLGIAQRFVSMCEKGQIDSAVSLCSYEVTNERALIASPQNQARRLNGYLKTYTVSSFTIQFKAQDGNDSSNTPIRACVEVNIKELGSGGGNPFLDLEIRKGGKWFITRIGVWS